MPNTRLYYRTFNGGEIAPQMTGRIDDVKFQSGAATVRNAVSLPHGPARRRPGTKFVNSTKSNSVARLIPFQVGIQSNYVIEVGDLYLRFHLQGGTMQPAPYVWRSSAQNDSVPWLAGTLSLAVASAGQPWTVYWPSHGLVDGERVTLQATGLESTLVAGQVYYVVSASSGAFLLATTEGGAALTHTASALHYYATNLQIYRRYFPGEAVSRSGTNYYCKTEHNGQLIYDPPTMGPAGYWYAMPSGTYEMPSPYAAADVFALRYVQSNDVLTIVHPSYAPRELRRSKAAEFSLTSITFAAQVTAPASVFSVATFGERIRVELLRDTGDELQTFLDHLLSVGDPVYISGCAGGDGVLRSCTFAAASGVWQITLASHGFIAGDAVHFAATTLPTGISGANAYYVRNATTNTFEIGTALTSATSVASGGVTGTAVTVQELVGVADGFYLAGTGTATNKLTLRTYSTGEAITFTFPPTHWHPLAGYVQFGSQTPDTTNYYQITAVDSTNQESLPSTAVSTFNNLFAAGSYNTLYWKPTSGSIRYNIYKRQGSLYGYIGQTDTVPLSSKNATFAAASGVWQITSTAHGLSNGDGVMFSADSPLATYPTNITATVAYYVRNATANTFQVGATPTSTASVASGGSTGTLVTFQKLNTFIDDNIAPDLAQSPPLRDADDLVVAGKYPGAVTYYEQRRCFAGSNTEPQSIYMTRSGTESDLAYSIPTKDDDRIKFKVAAREANQIIHMVPLGQLVLMTNSAEWKVTSVNSDALTPSSVSVQPQSYTGASVAQPEVINNSMIFCAARGGHVRELAYNWQAQGFVTGDLSLRANHLFDNLTITDIAYQKSPTPIVWFVSSNGKLLGMTYVPEEQVSAWHQHDTSGTFESVCAIPEGDEDRVYVVVNRGTSGSPKRYVERMDKHNWTELRDVCFLDSAVQIDGTHTGGVSITVTGAAYIPGTTVTLSATGQFQAPPVVTDVGDYLVLLDAAGSEYAILVTSTTNANTATGTLLSTLPVSLQATPVATWGWARNTFTGLSHLNGMQVETFGGWKQLPYSVTPATVSAGSVTLDTPVFKGHLGLPFTTDLRTLPAAMQIDGFGQGRNKNIVNSWLKLEQTAGITIGADEDNMVSANPYVTGPTLVTEEVSVQLTPTWRSTGQVLIRQTKPYPMTVIGLTLEASLGG